jgi:RNA polymerase sigma-70 factor (ECF subfamily)
MAADSKVELSESLTMSFLILLQNLNPVERSIFLLKEIFDYSFKEVSELAGKSETACRKIAERARDSLQDKERKFPKPPADSEKLIRQFFEAAKLGDRPRLMSLLSEKSEFLSDGGGKVSAAPPMLGAPEKIAEFFLSLRNYPVFTSADYRMETKWVNSRPGMIISKRATDGLWYFETIISCEIENNQIARMFSQRNPDKLNRLTFMDRGK